MCSHPKRLPTIKTKTKQNKNEEFIEKYREGIFCRQGDGILFNLVMQQGFPEKWRKMENLFSVELKPNNIIN